MASAEVLFVVIHRESSTVAADDGDTDFTLVVDIVDSRASPRQKGADPLLADRCLDIITLKQASRRKWRVPQGQGQRSSLGAQHSVMSEKGLAVEVALSACRDSDPDDFTHLFGLSSCRTAPGLLPCYGYLTVKLQGALLLLFIYPPSVLCKG